MTAQVFFLGSHPALSAAELVASVQRSGVSVSWDWSRIPVALLGSGSFPAPPEIQERMGGTTMIGTLRTTLAAFPTATDLIHAVPELSAPRQGKRLIGLSALPCPPGSGLDLAPAVRQLAIELKRALGLKGTRVVFPPARRPDLSTAQLFHNGLPRRGVAIFLIVGKSSVDLVTLDALQDIEAYARRDRGRPKVDPGHGMLPPKLAQILINLSLVPPGGTIYDPFCGVGTIPMEALLMGLGVIASDRSEKQVVRTKENLEWLRQSFPAPEHPTHPTPEPRVFVHDVMKGPITFPPRSVDAVVTEGWLGPPLAAPPSPREVEIIFSTAKNLIEKLLSSMRGVLRKEGRIVVTVPAFRIGKRIVRFPIDVMRAPGFHLEPLLPTGVDHEIFREAASGTLLYGRPDAVTLREIVRFR